LKILNISKLAELLQLPPDHIYVRLLHRIPHFRLGGAIRFREIDMLAWLEEQKQEPIEDRAERILKDI
jgi:predicted DNA-binding transcriptional regulator AlpA